MKKVYIERSRDGFTLIELPVVRKRGFTLIELLIVIGIIITIAALVIVSVSKARARGRDAKRISDLSQIQLAMEMYKDGAGNGRYLALNVGPPASWGLADDGISEICSATPNPCEIADYLRGYLSPFPKDPLNKNNYVYRQTATSSNNYWLSALFEDPDNIPDGHKLGNKCYELWGGTATDSSRATAYSIALPTGCN